MKKIWLILCVLLLVPVYGQELPYSEIIELKTADDHYDLEKVVSIYVKEDSTFEIENRVVSVNLAPQDYCEYQGTLMKEYFCDIMVSVVIADSDGKTLQEFQSYLNFEIAEQRMLWDHAGYATADRAGQTFGQDDPLTVAEKDLEVTLTLTHLTPSEYNCGNCETDAETLINFIDTIRFRLEIAYTQSQLDTIEEMQEDMEKYGDAQEYVIQAQQYFSQGEFKKAKDEFQKAQDLFDQTGDTENYDDMQEWINKCISYDIATENFKDGIDMFEKASTTSDYQEAITKFEEARAFFQRARIEFDNVEDTTKSDECDTWIDRCNDEIENLEGVGALRGRLIYIILAIVVVAVGGLLLKQLGKGKAPKHVTKGIALTVRHTETGQTVKIQVEPTDKIGKVRQVAATKLGVVPSALVYNGEVCPPDWTVQESGLVNGATVEIVPKKESFQPADDRKEKLERLEQRYREGKISRELYENLKRKLEGD